MDKGSSLGDRPDAARADPPGHVTVVGIGASAGGLGALKTFFANVPPDSGVAWVVVVHLSPSHESRLAELLQPHASIPVSQVVETTPIEADRIYVIPPNANLNAVDTHLRLSDLEEPARQRAPVDHFFRTLARTHDGHSVGVILTGTGSDGTQGLREIKAKGGPTLVQDPDEAEYDGMPRSAIATGDVDAVLPVAEIPEAVLRLSRVNPRLPADDETAVEVGDRRLTERIFTLVRAGTGRDFSRYKRATVLRRVARRMQLRHVEELSAYLDVLREDPVEVDKLADDLLITVTSFFRDPEAFDALSKDVLPRLFRDKGAGDSVRVWSVGCATGEEAYSLAMLLLEEAERHRAPPRLQVFATDLHAASLARARDGIYTQDIEADVSPERLKRFFEPQKQQYRVRKEVRELVLFSPHDLLGDPPFSRLDLVSCRNVLIYLQRDVQREILELFHYCLVPDGGLVLGTSETAEASGLFRVEDKEHLIYRRRAVHAHPIIPVFPLTRTRHPEGYDAGLFPRPGPMPETLHQRALEKYGPPSLLVGPDDRVVYSSENAGRYLVYPRGEPTADVYRILREELRTDLRVALTTARRAEEGTARSRPVRVALDGGSTTVVLHARQTTAGDLEEHVLIVFEERGLPEEDEPGDGDDEVESRAAAAERRLDAVIEEYEASRQQAHAANEELQSSNEELRATMEELETSKEELQSINEELQAVNEENRHKVEELAQLSDDLSNLLVATDIATAFLDRDLRILRFTPKLTELFNVLPTDHGRPISDLTHRLRYPAILQDARAVLDRLTPVESEVRDERGRWYLTRMLPYRAGQDHIAGVVISFIDITARKELEDALLEAKTFAESVVDSLHESLLILEPDLRVRTANPAFYLQFRVDPGDTVGRSIFELGNGQWDIPQLREALERVLPKTRSFDDFEVDHDFEGIGRRYMLVNARQLDHVQLILLGIRDVTAIKQHEEELRAARQEAERASRIKSQFLATMSHELRTPLNAVIGLSELLAAEVSGPTSPEQRRHLERIKRAAWHVVSVIDEILTFARSEAGQEELHVGQTDLAVVAQDVVGMLEASATLSGREIHLAGTERDVPAVTDADKVRQILTNLVGNAIKYGEGQVDVELTASDEWVELRVSDRGPGIPDDQLEAVFDPFVRLSHPRQRASSGTGLGLSISRRLARMLGGDVELESVREGSTFTLRLPRGMDGDSSADESRSGATVGPSAVVPRDASEE